MAVDQEAVLPVPLCPVSTFDRCSIDVICVSPGGPASAARVVDRVRDALAELGPPRVVVRVVAAPAARQRWPGVFFSDVVGTVVVTAHGRVVAQVVGALPARELRALVAAALLAGP